MGTVVRAYKYTLIMAGHLHCSTQPSWQLSIHLSKEAQRPVSVLRMTTELDVFGTERGNLAMVLFPLLQKGQYVSVLPCSANTQACPEESSNHHQRKWFKWCLLIVSVSVARKMQQFLTWSRW